MREGSWERVEELFAESLRRPQEDRQAFVQRESLGDPVVREEVFRLLAADREAGSFIEEALDAGARTVMRRDGDPRLGTRLGAYRLVSVLGRGGISTVYLALRDDAQYQKRVAVKLVRRGMDTEDILRRFSTERQILASLDHPNIARLLDGGTTADGLPFFVMELIEGVPIDRYCSRHRLAVEARLELFLEVCSAVQYAHQNLVIHRDLKPSNVLVTPQGVPKLLDFGIAKLLNPELAAPLAEPTAYLMRLMTPAYASPEQVRGEPVTTATDVYSLGVLLYELLTLRRPYEPTDPAPGELERRTLEQEPERPSTAASRPPVAEVEAEVEAAGSTQEARRPLFRPAGLVRRLRGDLDNILLTALRKEPERRYPSVEKLADDLRRHLSGRPVLARQAGLGYRFGKFVRRNRLAVTAATAFVALLVAFAAVTWNLYQKASLERDRSEQVSELAFDLFEITGRERGASITARELLDRGAEQVAELEDPVTRARMLEHLGLLYERLHLFQQAVPSLEKAVDLLAEVEASEATLGTAFNHLGRVRARSGDFRGAAESFRRSAELSARGFGEQSAEVSSALNNLALALQDLGDYDGALPIYRRALALDRKLLGPQHPATLITLSNYGLLLHDRGDYPAAEQIFRECLEMQRRNYPDGGQPIAYLLHFLAMSLTAQGRDGEARPLLEEAVAESRRANEPDELAGHLTALAGIRRRAGDLDGAARQLAEAHALTAELLGEDHPELAATLIEEAELAAARGSIAEAETLFARSISLYRASFSADYPLLGHSFAGLGILRAENGRCAEAVPALEEALRLLPPADFRVAGVRRALAGCAQSA